MQIKFKNIGKDFHPTKALAGVTFTASGGDIVGIIGPNGAGKTTLLKIAALISRPSMGEVYIGSTPSAKIDRSKLGLISPDTFLYNDLTVAENLKLYARLYKRSGDWKKSAEYFNLTKILNKSVRTLSHGQKKRASLARAMIGQPDILLLDEPFLGLDTEATGELKNLIMKMHSDGKLVLMATHQFDIAENIINKLMILDKGEMIHYEPFESSHATLNQVYEKALGGAK